MVERLDDRLATLDSRLKALEEEEAQAASAPAAKASPTTADEVSVPPPPETTEEREGTFGPAIKRSDSSGHRNAVSRALQMLGVVAAPVAKTKSAASHAKALKRMRALKEQAAGPQPAEASGEETSKARSGGHAKAVERMRALKQAAQSQEEPDEETSKARSGGHAKAIERMRALKQAAQSEEEVDEAAEVQAEPAREALADVDAIASEVQLTPAEEEGEATSSEPGPREAESGPAPASALARPAVGDPEIVEVSEWEPAIVTTEAPKRVVVEADRVDESELAGPVAAVAQPGLESARMPDAATVGDLDAEAVEELEAEADLEALDQPDAPEPDGEPMDEPVAEPDEEAVEDPGIGKVEEAEAEAGELDADAAGEPEEVEEPEAAAEGPESAEKPEAEIVDEPAPAAEEPEAESAEEPGEPGEPGEGISSKGVAALEQLEARAEELESRLEPFVGEDAPAGESDADEAWEASEPEPFSEEDTPTEEFGPGGSAGVATPTEVTPAVVAEPEGDPELELEPSAVPAPLPSEDAVRGAVWEVQGAVEEATPDFEETLAVDLVREAEPSTSTAFYLLAAEIPVVVGILVALPGPMGVLATLPFLALLRAAAWRSRTLRAHVRFFTLVLLVRCMFPDVVSHPIREPLFNLRLAAMLATTVPALGVVLRGGTGWPLMAIGMSLVLGAAAGTETGSLSLALAVGGLMAFASILVRLRTRA